MPKNFTYYKLKWKHKKVFIIHQLTLFLIIFMCVYFPLKEANIVLTESSDKISVTIGGMVLLFVLVLAFTNRIKKLFQVKFVGLAVLWVIFVTLGLVIEPLTMALGYALLPLMLDDTIMNAYWNKVWYNEYD